MSISENQRAAFMVGAWWIEPSLNRITRADAAHEVEPKVMQVLVCLAAQAGEVVTRDDLLETVWAGTYVTNVTLTRCVSELRKVLDDDPQAPQYIETIRKAGYRLIAPVTQGRQEEASARVHAVPSTPSWIWGLGAGGLLALIFVGVIRWPGSSAEQTPAVVDPLLPFTSLVGPERQPAVVPHGDQVAFVWQAPDSTDADLYLKQVGRTDLVPLTRTVGAEAWPAWRMDGKELAFVRQGEQGCRLLIVDALGTHERRVGMCDGETIAGLAWSPDGRQLAYATQAMLAEPYRLVAYTLATRQHEVLTRPATTRVGDRYPAFRDATTLAFVRSRHVGDDDVFRLDLETRAVQQLTDGHHPVAGLTWTQDRRHLIFASNRDGRYALWTLLMNEGRLERLNLPGAEHVRFPNVPRLSYGLVVEQVTETANLWQLRDGQHGELAVSTAVDHAPTLSADGMTMAFISTRSGHAELWTHDATTGAVRQLTQFAGARIADPQWSPDGQRIAFVVQTEGRSQLYIHDADSGEQTVWSEAVHYAQQPRWSRDGTAIYWSSDHTGDWQLWQRLVADTRIHQVTQDGGYRSAESTEPDHLYVTKYRQRNLWDVDLVTGEETLVQADFLEHPDEPWTYTAGQFYRLDAATQIVWSRDEDASLSAWQPVAAVKGAVLDFAVSAEGKTIVYSRREQDERDIWLHASFYNR